MEWRRVSVSWEDLSARARSASSRHQPRRTSCLSLPGESWRWARATPQSDVREAPFSRCSRCQFPKGTSRPRSEPAQERQLTLGAHPSPRHLVRRKEWLGGNSSETSRRLRRSPSFGSGGGEIAEMCRSTKTTGAPAAGVEPAEGGYPVGGSRLLHLSLRALRSRAWTFGSAYPAISPGCLGDQSGSSPGPTWTKARV